MSVKRPNPISIVIRKKPRTSATPLLPPEIAKELMRVTGLREEDLTPSILANFLIDSYSQLAALEGHCASLEGKISSLENDIRILLQQNKKLLAANQKLRDDYEELREDHNQQVDAVMNWAEQNLS